MRSFFVAKYLLLTLLLAVASASAKDILTIGVQSSEIGSLDPAIGYEWSNLELLPALNSGLLKWDEGKKVAVPNLAQSMEISDDGRTLRFKLRDDIYFHNGRAITASDFVFSYERIVHPDTKSPYRSFFENIAGFQSFSSGSAQHLSGLIALSPLLLEIHLSEPDAAFITVLSQWIGSVVPREAVDDPNFAKLPVGAGEYRLVSRSNNTLKLEKFRLHPRSSKHHADQIDVISGLTDSAFLQGVRRGEIDYVAIFQPSNQFLHLSTDAAYKPYLYMVDTPATTYLSLNTQKGPLRNIELRRAINMAIDKHAIQEQVFSNTGTVTGHILPPSLRFLTSYDEPHPYNPSLAQSIVHELSIEPMSLLVLNQSISIQAAQMIISDLQKIGVDCRMVIASESEFMKSVKDKKIDMIYSDGISWISDYADPSNFYFPLFSPSAYGDGYNWSGFSDLNIHARALEINSWAGSKNNIKRQLAWENILHKIQKDGIPWVPLNHIKTLVLTNNKNPKIEYFLSNNLSNNRTNNIDQKAQ